jgi:magnesium transporter
MRVFHLNGNAATELAQLPEKMPEAGFVWISTARAEFEAQLPQLQATLQALCGLQLVDLHVSDLLNKQLPSHYDYTSQYDVLVFRRLATSPATREPDAETPRLARRGGPPVLQRIDTSPVGFAIFDRVLLTVHPADCSVRDSYAGKLLHGASPDSRGAGVRLPASPADLMLRIVNQMVDGYLELRRELTRQLDHWQAELLKPGSRFNNWSAVLEARLSLHHLDETCEDQRAAMQDWIDSLETWPDPETLPAQRERDLLKVRSRDVLEHIERVVHHVQRLEHSAEAAVQMHFSAQGNRTNDIMRVLTALTAVFLPLNFITGFFGMNFEFLPLIHSARAMWIILGVMVAVAIVIVLVFWRKRYLARVGR